MSNYLRLEKSAKILTTCDYKRVMQRGHKVVSPYFVFLALPAQKRRVGIIVSKKVAKSAVIRNTIKRRIRECYRTTPLLLVSSRRDAWFQEEWPRLEMVIIARRSIIEACSEDIAAELLSDILRMLGMLKSNKSNKPNKSFMQPFRQESSHSQAYELQQLAALGVQEKKVCESK